MSIRVVLPTFWYSLVNDLKTVDVEGRTVSDCLNSLILLYPQLKELLFDEFGTLHGYISIHINEKGAYPGELDKVVYDGDEMRIIAIISGG